MEVAFSFEKGTKLHLVALKRASNLNFIEDHTVGIVAEGWIFMFLLRCEPLFLSVG
jgi:hypothetical protein